MAQKMRRSLGTAFTPTDNTKIIIMTLLEELCASTEPVTNTVPGPTGTSAEIPE